MRQPFKGGQALHLAPTPRTEITAPAPPQKTRRQRQDLPICSAHRRKSGDRIARGPGPHPWRHPDASLKNQLHESCQTGLDSMGGFRFHRQGGIRHSWCHGYASHRNDPVRVQDS